MPQIEKDGKLEDKDVRLERERVERGLYDPNALIQIFSLHKAYRERVALHNLTLKVPSPAPTAALPLGPPAPR